MFVSRNMERTCQIMFISNIDRENAKKKLVKLGKFVYLLRTRLGIHLLIHGRDYD